MQPWWSRARMCRREGDGKPGGARTSATCGSARGSVRRVDDAGGRTHIAGMTQLDDGALAELGRAAARRAVGPDKIETVAVSAHVNRDDELVYDFWYRWEQEPDWKQIGELILRLGLDVRDELVARGDYSFPLIHILTKEDWAKSKRDWDKMARA